MDTRYEFCIRVERRIPIEETRHIGEKDEEIRIELAGHQGTEAIVVSEYGSSGSEVLQFGDRDRIILIDDRQHLVAQCAQERVSNVEIASSVFKISMGEQYLSNPYVSLAEHLGIPI